jgi:hypothetical protein
MADIFVGSVAVGVVPDARGWNEKLRAQLVPSSSSVGNAVGQNIGRQITTQMGKAGAESGGAFSDTFRKRVKAALDALPRDATGPIAEMRAKLEALANTKIIDGDKAIKELVKIDTGIEELRRKSKDIELKFNTTEARAQLALLRRDVNATGQGAGGRGGILGFLGGLPGIGGLFGGGAGAQGGAQAAASAASGGGSLLTNPYVLGGGAIAAAGLAPFAGQAAGGLLTGGLGLGLAGLGIAGAFGVGGSTAAQTAAARTQLQASQAAAATSQANLNKLRDSGKASTAQLAAAEANLAQQQQKVTSQQQALGQMNQLTAGQEKVRQGFTNVKNSAEDAVNTIGQSFVPVMENIFTVAQSVIKRMTPVFATVMQVIRGPFDVLVTTVLKAFTDPAVIKSIQDVASAFADIMQAFTPDIPGIMNSFAEAISRMAQAIQKNPKAFANFINFLFQIVIATIDAIAWLTVAANYIEAHWFPVIAKVADWIAHHWDIIGWFVTPLIMLITHLHQFEATWINIWNSIWNNTVGRVIRGGHDIEVAFNNLKSWITSWFNRLMIDMRNWWDIIWNNTVGRVVRGWSDVRNAFNAFKGWLGSFFSDAVHWLENAGSDIIQGMLNGIKSAMSGIAGWVQANIVNPVVNWVKHFFGIASPSTVMAGIGANLILGLMRGMFSSGKDLTHFVKNIFGGLPQALGHFIEKGLVDISKIPATVLAKLTGVFKSLGGFFAKMLGFGGGGNVSQWSGTVIQALSMLGLPLSLLGNVLHQMSTESGGNPNAINLTDINAQQGDPSRGLMQVIGSTFAAYHVPGTSSNIYDPLANIAAALNYARAVYGPTLMRGGMGVGSGHGYDVGGWWPPGTFGWNTSGQHELVVTQEQLRAGAMAGGSAGPEYHAHFDGLTGQAIESHVRTAFVAMSLQQGQLSRQGRRS